MAPGAVAYRSGQQMRPALYPLPLSNLWKTTKLRQSLRLM